LQQAHINLVRQEPQGFVTLSESTLSDDPDWTLINVRRLISLMRRLAQRYGPTWVFEPNDPAFARLVKRTFTSLLDQMFARGAFAGTTPETSYQVNVRVTPQDIDAGRFTVELCVAPSLPMRFITIRLVQSGERSLVTEGG
jgi:phage tail sheath protein FI